VATDVAVVGIGIVGLSTAWLALQAGLTVTLYTDRELTETTSARAAASFKPTAVEYDARTARFARDTWDTYERILADHGEATGVRKHLHVEASSSPIERPPYLDLMEDACARERPLVPGGYAHAWQYRTFFIDTSRFLPWLLERCRTQGAELVHLERGFESLVELSRLPQAVVFNCTGLGARALCGDDRLVAVKGQVAVVGPQPEMDWSIKADGFYVYPRASDTILGATEEWDVDDERPERGAIDAIVRANRRILPHLTLADVRRTYAGLRPFRQGGIRLEREVVNGKPIIHDYGHGGAGFTLCWGSARAAVELR
jgi:D-amino-acid oxidase